MARISNLLALFILLISPSPALATSGFFDPADQDAFSWPVAPGATLYEAARASRPYFNDCITITTTDTLWSDPTQPQLGEVLYYLDRVLEPATSGWGDDSDGIGRSVPCSRPTYDSFLTPADCDPQQCGGDDPPLDIESCLQLCLDRAAEASTRPLHIFVPARFRPGGNVETYEIDNPITVNRPFFLHGGSARNTVLVPKNPGPVFVVDLSPHFNLTGIEIEAPPILDGQGVWVFGACCTDPGDPCCVDADNLCPLYEPNRVGLRVENPSVVKRIEVLESIFRRVSMEIFAPGTYQLQSALFEPDGHLGSSLVLDHPDADLTFVGGGFANYPHQKLPWPADVQGPFNYLWQRQGRVRIYGALTAAVYGNADFRFDAPAPGWTPHVIAGTRSEGAKRLEVPYRSSFVYVPPSSAPVDIVLEGNVAGWTGKCEGTIPANRIGGSHLIDYNAAGTVWLLQNVSQLGSRAIAVGDAPAATIIALGNHIFTPDILPINAGTEIFAGNLYSWLDFTGCDLPQGCLPRHRLVNPGVRLSDYQLIPPPPMVEVPEPLVRPPLNVLLPGMIDADACGADPTDSADDRAPLQAALDAVAMGNDCLDGSDCDSDGTDTSPTCGRGGVLLSQGTYAVGDALQWFHEDQFASYQSESDLGPPRIWIAGAGPAATTIEATSGSAVLQTERMQHSTIQGITFLAPAYQTPAVPPEPVNEANVQIEYDPGNAPGSNVTSAVHFHDCVFDGGKYALGMALESPIQTDAMMMARCKFKNAKYGFANGGQNALGNVIYDPAADPSDPTFLDNQITMGTPDYCPASPPPCCVDPIGAPGPGCERVDQPPCEAASDIPLGGTFVVLGAMVRGTARQELQLPAGPIYIHGLDTTTETIHDRCNPGTTGAGLYVFFDRSRFERTDPNRLMFDWRGGGGPFFLHSSRSTGFVTVPYRINAAASAAYAINLGGPPLWAELQQPWSSLADVHRLYRRSLDPCAQDPDCNDGVPETDDLCINGICWNPPIGCDDLVDCTVDRVVDGQCKNYPQDLLCDDGRLCTGESQSNLLDVCDEESGCSTPDNPGAWCPECEVVDCDFGPITPWCTIDDSITFECLRTDQAPPTSFTCSSDGDFYGDRVLVHDWTCSPDDCEPLEVECACESDAQCDDERYCNGIESCGAGGCVAGAIPCPADDCVEFIDLCLAPCPGDWCDAAPDGCASTDTGLNACRSDHGAVLGCPVGQTIRTAPCDCLGEAGTSWICQ